MVGQLSGIACRFRRLAPRDLCLISLASDQRSHIARGRFSFSRLPQARSTKDSSNFASPVPLRRLTTDLRGAPSPGLEYASQASPCRVALCNPPQIQQFY